MRMYTPAWNKLKLDRTLRLAVPRPLHRRVIRAISKEKWQDEAWKFLRSEEGYWDEIRYSCKGNIIEFSLVSHIYITVSAI